MIIRKAELTDAASLATNNMHLAWETEQTHLDHDTTLQGVASLLKDKHKGFYLISVEKDQIIGQVMITYEWSDWYNYQIWWLQSVYVVPKKRREKIFHLLFTEIKNLARKQGVSLLKLYVRMDNQAAQQVYTKIGMRKSDYYIYSNI